LGIRELGDKLAAAEGQLEKSRVDLDRLKEENTREQRHILSAFGRRSVGVAAWLTAGFYVLLSILAVGAEFPISRMTVNEAIGTGTTASLGQMGVIQDYSVWAVAIVLCLIGFSLKPLFDVLDRGKGHFLWEIALVGAALIPCATAIYGVAQLREAISNPILTKATTGDPQNQDDGKGAADTMAKKQQAADEERKWTAYTFKWITIALPLFSAMCLIISLHQVHNFRGHNHGARTLNQNDSEIGRLDQLMGQLKYAIEHERKQMEAVSDQDPFHSDFQDRSVAAYNHGRATGQAVIKQRLNELPLYQKLNAEIRSR